MSPEFRLATAQRWMQRVIMAAGGDEEAVRKASAAEGIAPARALEMVLPSHSLTRLERLGIYRGMYEARMREALEVDYPLLSGFLGEELWEEFVSVYIREYPSRSYTLNRLGDFVPLFATEIEGLPRPRFVEDLARYELALTQVFDAPETPALTPGDVAAVPEEAWPVVRLAPIAAFRLEEFRYPVNRYAEAAREKPETPVPRPKKTRLAIFRRDYTPMALELSKPGFDLLGRLAAGMRLGEAIEASRAPEAALFSWFQEWTGEGLFQRVEF